MSPDDMPVPFAGTPSNGRHASAEAIPARSGARAPRPKGPPTAAAAARNDVGLGADAGRRFLAVAVGLSDSRPAPNGCQKEGLPRGSGGERPRTPSAPAYGECYHAYCTDQFLKLGFIGQHFHHANVTSDLEM